MIIAVTGASGHVGMNLCKELIQRGYQVKALAHKHMNDLRTLTLTVVHGDVLDKKSLTELVKDAEIVFHLAAKISITGDPDGLVSRINIDGTRNMLEVAGECGVRRFIHFSSIHACRQHPLHEPLDESRSLVGHEGFVYDRSKAEAEQMVLNAAGNQMDVVVLSPTAIIGPADHEPSLTGKAMIDLYNGKIPMLIPGGYDWVDVRDVVTGAIAAIERGRSGEKYLLSGKWYSLSELSALVHLHSGRRTVSGVIPMWIARAGLPFITLYSWMSGTIPLYTSESLTIISEGNRMISHEKAKRELNFEPRPFTDTIRDFIIWLRENDYIQ